MHVHLSNADLNRFLIKQVHMHRCTTQCDTSIQHSPHNFNFILASKLISQPHAPCHHVPHS